MSERLPRLSPGAALRQVDALLAWVLLGWLGQQLGWSVASGVLPVVLWWTLRCSGGRWAARSALPGLLRAWSPVLAAAGLLVLLFAPAGVQQLLAPVVPTSHAKLAALLLCAGLWGLWSGSLAATPQTRPATLPGQAMGLMMGSLWLSSQWCLGPGWTDAQAVILHLGLMLGVPALLAAYRHLQAVTGHASGWPAPGLQTLLLALGALLLAWPQHNGGGRLLGMGLVVLAWSLASHSTIPITRASLPVPAVLGPMLLLAVGLWAPGLGPAAMQYAWACIGALALAGLALSRPAPAQPAPPNQRWSDIS